MGFRNGGPRTREHNWSNHPDKCRCICTKCGILRIMRTVERKTILEYHLKDGSVTLEVPKCEGKSLYERLMEED